jgi:hypothetical protein
MKIFKSAIFFCSFSSSPADLAILKKTLLESGFNWRRETYLNTFPKEGYSDNTLIVIHTDKYLEEELLDLIFKNLVNFIKKNKNSTYIFNSENLYFRIKKSLLSENFPLEIFSIKQILNESEN